MKVYGATFPSMWVGGSAVIVAANEAGARRRLRTAMKARGLDLTTDHDLIRLTEIPVTEAGTVEILTDGDY